MPKVKTSELTGAALDWAVAKCENVRTYIRPYEHTMTGLCILDADLVDMETDGAQELRYSRDWNLGGSIIEREMIDLLTDKAPSLGPEYGWIASIPHRQNGQKLKGWRILQYGPTPLIAAMRCFCCSKLGDEVEVPDELL